jgi:hypothetical protein
MGVSPFDHTYEYGNAPPVTMQVADPSHEDAEDAD